jgi:hypothetical protein
MKTKSIKARIINTLTPIILLCLFLCAGCTKDTLIGPTGPTGPTGATGPAGNANVEEYQFYTLSTDWNQSGNSWTANYSSVTINITDAVMVYVSNSSSYSNNIVLPNISTSGIQTYFSNTTNVLSITVNSINNTTMVTNPGIQYYKIVIIPSSLRLSNVNHNNFADVKAAYHLK